MVSRRRARLRTSIIYLTFDNEPSKTVGRNRMITGYQ